MLPRPGSEPRAVLFACCLLRCGTLTNLSYRSKECCDESAVGNAGEVVVGLRKSLMSESVGFLAALLRLSLLEREIFISAGSESRGVVLYLLD